MWLLWSYVYVLLSAFWLSVVSGQGTVTLVQQPQDQTVCNGTRINFMCDITGTGILQWRDEDGNNVQFTAAANNPGDSATVGVLFVNLTNEASSTLLSSTALIARLEMNIAIVCSNGVIPAQRSVSVAGPLSSRISSLMCSYFRNQTVVVSWTAPTATPNCCVRYLPIVSGLNTPMADSKTNTSFTFEDGVHNATVNVSCLDAENQTAYTSPNWMVFNDPMLAVEIVANDTRCNEEQSGSVTVQVLVVENIEFECRPRATVMSLDCLYGNELISRDATNLGNAMYKCQFYNNGFLRNVTVVVEREDGVTESITRPLVVCPGVDRVTAPAIGAALGAVIVILAILFAVLIPVFLYLLIRKNKEVKRLRSMLQAKEDVSLKAL